LLKIAHPDYRAELKEQIVSTGQIAAEEFDD
jgi:acyl-CoA hydrolase